MVRRRTILFVDDNRDLRDNLCEVLEDAGFRAYGAGSCAEARAFAQPFDVALVDVRLPDGDGTALAGELRARRPDAQIIMLTGFATIESAVAAVRAGAWAFLLKPCAIPELLVTVEQAIRQVAHLEERRVLARRAQTAEKLAAIGTLTAGLSHEIKNPLNAAGLQLMVLERRLGKLPEDMQGPLREPLQLVKDEIARLNHLLEEFLDFARPRQLRLVTVDLAVVVARLAALVRAQAEAGQVKLEVVDQGPAQVRGDEERLQQAFLNLLLNAIQATPAGGVVRVFTHAHGEGAEVVIEDSGPGVPEEVHERIFEPFFTTKAGGSGLGLPLVHGIVNQHGGSIAVERATSGGARFVVRIPADA